MIMIVMLRFFLLCFFIYSLCSSFFPLGAVNVAMACNQHFLGPPSPAMKRLASRLSLYFNSSLIFDKAFPHSLKIYSDRLVINPQRYGDLNNLSLAETVIKTYYQDKLTHLDYSIDKPENLELLGHFLSYQGAPNHLRKFFNEEEGKWQRWLEFLPISPYGHPLNRLAHYAQKFYQTKIIFNPAENNELRARGYYSFFHQHLSLSKEEVISGNLHEYQTSWHELRHAQNHAELRDGVFSLYHDEIKAINPQKGILPRDKKARSYQSYQHLSEIPNHLADIKQISFLLKRSLADKNYLKKRSSLELFRSLGNKLDTLEAILYQSFTVYQKIWKTKIGQGERKLSNASSLTVVLRNHHHRVTMEIKLSEEQLYQLVSLEVRGRVAQKERLQDKLILEHIDQIEKKTQALLMQTRGLQKKLNVINRQAFKENFENSIAAFHRELLELWKQGRR